MSGISKLDLLVAGRRNPLSRIGSLERQTSLGTTIPSFIGTFTPAPVVAPITQPSLPGSSQPGAEEYEAALTSYRPNLLINSSFEQYRAGTTVPVGWTAVGGAALVFGVIDADGSTTVRLSNAGTISAAAGTADLDIGALVVSVFARTAAIGQIIGFTLTTGADYIAGPVVRTGANETSANTNNIPADGEWYRFEQCFILKTGPEQTSFTITSANTTGVSTVDIDAAKAEYLAGVQLVIAASEYRAADVPSYIPNLLADDIIVGGSNPSLTVQDGLGNVLIQIGPSTEGILVSGTGGIRISGSGSIIAGDESGSRTEITDNGLIIYGLDGITPTIELSHNDGGSFIASADLLEITGQLDLDSAAVSGAITVGQDLTVGANVLFVDQSQSNIGINRAPDLQFDLDVTGSGRFGGYIVGKHAIQLDEALLVVHFDGPGPIETNFTGSATGHLGQVPLELAADGERLPFVYLPGKFNKAIQVGPGIINYVVNSLFKSRDLTNWTISAG